MIQWHHCLSFEPHVIAQTLVKECLNPVQLPITSNFQRCLNLEVSFKINFKHEQIFSEQYYQNYSKYITNIKHSSEDNELDFVVIMLIGVDCATEVMFIPVSKKNNEVVFLRFYL